LVRTIAGQIELSFPKEITSSAELEERSSVQFTVLLDFHPGDF
jgi:hypothetical protein